MWFAGFGKTEPVSGVACRTETASATAQPELSHRGRPAHAPAQTAAKSITGNVFESGGHVVFDAGDATALGPNDASPRRVPAFRIN